MTLRLSAAALIVLALAACGGNAVKTHDNAAEVHWRSGLTSWGASMTRAINGISVLFSRPSSVRGIESGDRRTAAKLGRLEQTLSGCTEAVHRLGAAPGTLVTSRHEALHACVALEDGAALIRAGVRQVQHGLGADLLNRSSEPLAAGEDAVRRAELDLKPES